MEKLDVFSLNTECGDKCFHHLQRMEVCQIPKQTWQSYLQGNKNLKTSEEMVEPDLGTKRCN